MNVALFPRLFKHLLQLKESRNLTLGRIQQHILNTLSDVQRSQMILKRLCSVCRAKIASTNEEVRVQVNEIAMIDDFSSQSF